MAGLGYIRKEATTRQFFITTNITTMDAEEINIRRGSSATAELSFTDATFRDLMHIKDSQGNIEVSFGEVHTRTRMTIGEDTYFGTQYRGYFEDPALNRYGSIQEDNIGNTRQGGWLLASVSQGAKIDWLAEVNGSLRWIIKDSSGSQNINTDASSQVWTELRFYDDEDETTVVATKSYGSWNSSGKYWYWHSSIRPFGENSGNRYVELV
jgi:hypothetical protein